MSRSGLEPVERPSLAEPLRPIVPVVAMAGLMWASEIVDTVLGGDLDAFGIRPRRLDGLDGIVLSPFLHGGFGHLIANTFPFLLLGAVIALGGTRRFLTVTTIIALVGGIGTWLIGPSGTLHIGASGLVFGFITYLVTRGFFARKASYLLGGAVVAFLYVGALWGLLPRPGVSWQGHLFGAIGGVVAARAVHVRTRPDRLPAA